MILLDTVNIEGIKHIKNFISIDGITTSPSIILSENNNNFFEHMNDIENL